MRKELREHSARTAFRRIRFEPLESRHLLSASVYLSELVAWGGSDFVDADGESPDWIEITKAGDETADLTGWALTDDASDPDKWVFPSVSLDPDERLVVFASGKDRTDPQGELHTSFALDADGEYLALIDAEGAIVSEFEDGFPEQKSGLSYGCEPLTVETDLLDGASLVCEIPSQANAGDAWTEADFDATSWTGVDGTTLIAFTYSDDSPWPEGADGDGPTLELVHPGADPNVAESWQASVDAGGTPGMIPTGRTPGDLNGDRTVDSADLDLIRAQWGADVNPGAWNEGYPSGDGLVGSADLDVVRAHWGQGTPRAAPSAGTNSCVPAENFKTDPESVDACLAGAAHQPWAVRLSCMDTERGNRLDFGPRRATNSRGVEAWIDLVYGP